MEQILSIREYIIYFYKKYEIIINFIIKFITGLLIFNIINGIGAYREEFAPLFDGTYAFPFLMLMSLLFTIAPPTIANLLISLNVVMQISEHTEIALFVFLIFILVLVFYSRLAPKKSYLILATILGFYFRVPYATAIFAGLYCGLSSIIPVSLGIIIWNYIPSFKELSTTITPVPTDDFDVMSILTGILDTYKSILSIVTNNFDWIFTAFIFAMIILAVYAISRLSIDYSKDIAIGSGALIGVLGFIVGSMVMKADYSILSVFLFMILSAIMIEAVKFFDGVLDYKKAERVQFEDEENYYYVRIIPKIIINKDLRAAKVPARSAPPPRIPHEGPRRTAASVRIREDVAGIDKDLPPLPQMRSRDLPPLPPMRGKISAEDILTEPRITMDREMGYVKRHEPFNGDTNETPSMRFINEMKRSLPEGMGDLKRDK